MRLDISIGPVQGFVAQSRRTRDLWGSSYLLSFLSAHAMHGTVEAGGRIDQPPIYDDPLYRRVAGGRAGDPPTTGSLPNHFVSHVDGDAGTVARAGAHALDVAWRRVCDAVRTRFVAHASDAGDGTDRIWQRQIGAFWEVTWTAGNSLDGGGLLARRKRWRSHRPPDEPGDKCTVMHDLQELSGYVRAQNRDARQRQDGFWDRVRERLGALELRDNERLCAIALVKRLFPRVATAALGWPLDTSHWPSTVYIGATPWLRRVVRTAPESARQYAEAVQELGPRGVLAERRPPFAGLDERAAGDFARLDGNYLHHECLQNARLCPLADDVGETAAPGPGREHRGPSSTATRHPHATTGATTRARRTLDGLLAALYDTRDETDRRLGAPASFYALLLADGDRLGRLVGTLGRERVGPALSTFTNQVDDIVRRHDGVTVYAGGDDVLAMLPVPGAMACATALSNAYVEAFASIEPTGQARVTATLSAAVVFAQARLPLGAVVAEAHRLLDDVAKEANGRDSLAAGVLKPGGLNCQWVTAWTRAGDDPASATTVLARLTERLREGAEAGSLSTTLLYRIRDTLIRLCGWRAWNPGHWGAVPPDLQVRAFLRAEILQSLTARSMHNAEASAGALTALILDLLQRARTPAEGQRSTEAVEVGVDALLLARFLADSDDQQAESGA